MSKTSIVETPVEHHDISRRLLTVAIDGGWSVRYDLSKSSRGTDRISLLATKEGKDRIKVVWNRMVTGQFALSRATTGATGQQRRISLVEVTSTLRGE